MERLLDDGRIKFGLKDDSSPKRKLYFKERLAKGDKKTPSSIMLDAGTTKDGTSEIMSIFNGEKVFDYPKPVNFIKKLIRYGAPNGGIIMDFFSGSGTTAQAVMETNNEKYSLYKYILVQLPENLDSSISEASQFSKKTIQSAIKMLDSIGKRHFLTEVAKERLKRIGNRIVDHDKIDKTRLDIGFRVLKLDESNMTDVYYSPDEYSQDLLARLESNIKTDRNDLDLLFSCLLEWGLSLSLPYSSEEIEGYIVHNYNKGDLIACFEENIPDSVVKKIAKKQPLRAVFRDSSFANSPSKINIGEIFKLLAPDTRVKVI